MHEHRKIVSQEERNRRTKQAKILVLNRWKNKNEK